MLHEYKKNNPNASQDDIKQYKCDVIEPKTRFEKGSIPTSVWKKNNHTTAKDFCSWHPTTKNIWILERMISAYTNKDDLVLDIFMGSGSTAIASNNLKRKVIGCERDSDYYSKLMTRIKDSDPLFVK